MESFVIYMLFNYFISAILTLHGSAFGVDFTQQAGPGTGLAMIANVKTLDMGMLGAIFIACCTAYLHNHFYDTNIPDWLGIFKGPAFVVAIGFAVMIPMALIFCCVWPMVQHAIEQFQFFLKTSGIVGVWAYTFSEKILLPAGLHHFIYLPFIYGPAIVDGGIQAYWLGHINDFMTNAQSLRDLFPEGGFALYLLHALLSATLSATLYAIGLSGNFGGGLIDAFVQNWIPLFSYHYMTYITQIGIGLCFTAIYFFVFRAVIRFKDYKTPGRTDDDVEDKLFTKADYKAKQAGAAGADAAASASDMKLDERDLKAKVFLEGLGGPANIKDVTNCATRLRVTVADPDLVQPVAVFTRAGAHGLVRNGHAFQVIVGLSVPQVRERFEALLTAPASDATEVAVGTEKSLSFAAVADGKVIDMSEVKDEMFSQKMMGDGVAVEPTGNLVVAPADAEVTMVMEDSLHAVGLRLANGAEMLIHIGVDTVKLGGKGFKLLVKAGDHVAQGAPLVEFDRATIKEAGYQDTVIMAVTNSGEYPLMKKHTGMTAEAGKTDVLTF